jgi:non-specific serine/threonine protein kinase/serine/threonine-protein kinase
MNDRVGSTDDESTVGLGDRRAHSASESPRVRGRYRARRLIAEGGMGQIWEAEQLEPVNRRVALKVIKSGLRSEEILSRFTSERQALALMDHRNIATLYDAGVTDDGRPYFAMELVDGVPVNEFCDQNRLGTRERLELIIDVCRGVQHAHQKAIIHRDLKPSNILVAIEDDRPVPKIIDFGIAKALERPLSVDAQETQFGQLLGTPAYMSPEQANQTSQQIDTRADIYSLGVVLYELLTGSLPFMKVGESRVSFDEIWRRIREDEPHRPSTRISRLGERCVTTANVRQTTPARLTSALRGDLDWIVMTALDKDPGRRYETINALQLDLQRHLDNEPVRACPPNQLYRVGKFVRRHRLPVAVGVAMILLLVLGTAGTAVGLLSARAAEQRATQEAATAQETSDFLIGLFTDSDPLEGQGQKVTARQLLDTGYEQAREDLAGQPVLQARLLHTLGSVYRSLGAREKASEALVQALETRRMLGSEHLLESAESLQELANLRRQQGRFTEALSLLEECLELRQEHLGEGHRLVGAALNDLALIYHDQNDLQRAEPYYRKALTIHRAQEETDHRRLGETLTSLSSLLTQRERLDEAEPMMRSAIDHMRAAHGGAHPYVAFSLHNLVWLLHELGNLEEADRVSSQSLGVMREALGEKHFLFANAQSLRGQILRSRGQLEEAEAVTRQAVQTSRDASGERHPSTAIALFNLGLILMDQGTHDEATAAVLEALPVLRESYGPHSEDVDDALTLLGTIAERDGDLERAQGWYQRRVELLREADPARPGLVACGLSVLGVVKARRGATDDGVSDLRRARELQLATEDHSADCRPTTLRRLGEALVLAGQHDAAEGPLREARSIYTGPLWDGFTEEQWQEGRIATEELLEEVESARNRSQQQAAGA